MDANVNTTEISCFVGRNEETIYLTLDSFCNSDYQKLFRIIAKRLANHRSMNTAELASILRGIVDIHLQEHPVDRLFIEEDLIDQVAYTLVGDRDGRSVVRYFRYLKEGSVKKLPKQLVLA